MAHVLLYHGFGDRSPEADPHHLFVPTEIFEAQLDHLCGQGWRALTLAEYVAGVRAGSPLRRSFLITIDDAYESALTIAAPVLRSRRLPSVLYVSPGRLGQTSAWIDAMPDERLLDADGLRDVQTLGMDIGVHGWDHSDMVGMSAAELDRHVVQARAALGDLIGVRPSSFAYPRGLSDPPARHAVERAGYDVAFGTDTASGGLHDLRRVMVAGNDPLRIFRWKLRPWWQPAATVAASAPALRRAVHEVARRGFRAQAASRR